MNTTDTMHTTSTNDDKTIAISISTLHSYAKLISNLLHDDNSDKLIVVKRIFHIINIFIRIFKLDKMTTSDSSDSSASSDSSDSSDPTYVSDISYTNLAQETDKIIKFNSMITSMFFASPWDEEDIIFEHLHNLCNYLFIYYPYNKNIDDSIKEDIKNVKLVEEIKKILLLEV
jgi:hypothetical protein